VLPPAYPTAVEYAPVRFQKIRSAHQKQPMPNMANSVPAGKGGSRRFQFTKWVAGITIRVARPGSASCGDGNDELCVKIPMAHSSCLTLVYTVKMRDTANSMRGNGREAPGRQTGTPRHGFPWRLGPWKNARETVIGLGVDESKQRSSTSYGDRVFRKGPSP